MGSYEEIQTLEVQELIGTTIITSLYTYINYKYCGFNIASMLTIFSFSYIDSLQIGMDLEHGLIDTTTKSSSEASGNNYHSRSVLNGTGKSCEIN